MDWWPPTSVVVADAHHFVQADLPRPIAQAALASLSADPETLDDFVAANRRFLIGRDWNWPARQRLSSPPEQLVELLGRPPADLLLLHLPARLVAAGEPDRFPLCATIPLIRDHAPTSQTLLYGLRGDWNSVPLDKAAAVLADPQSSCDAKRRLDRALETRRVLYGDLLVWIASQRLGGNDVPIVELHRQWLLTPRPSLDCRSPRDAIFEHFSFIDRDLEYQQHNWVVAGIQPPGLDHCSAAYLGAPFGRVELTIYHLLTRHLIEVYDRQFGTNRPCDDADLSQRVDWLHRQKQKWWNSPLENYDDRTPHEMVDGERRRIPLTMDPEKMANCDCPICRALAYEGPMFVILDFPPLEEEFVFSYCRTEAEWQENEAEYEV